MSGDLAGLTLDAVLGAGVEKPQQPQPPPPTTTTTAVPNTPTTTAQMNRTLLDIIRDEEPHGSLFGHKDKKSWKAFRDRLRLKRAGAAWTSTVPIPASDIPIHNSTTTNYNQSRSFMSRRNSVRFTTVSSVVNSGDQSPHTEDNNGNDYPHGPAVSVSRPFMVRRISSRYGSSPSPDENIHAIGDEPPSRSFRPQMSRHNSTRNSESSPCIDSADDDAIGGGSSRRLGAALAEERVLSAREAVAAQEAAEAEAAAQAASEAATEEEEGNSSAEGGGAQPVRMSLMDLLEETDRQMGFVGSRYTVGNDDEECEGEEEEEDDDDSGMNGGDGIEHTCCVCMVRHKGAAFIPCGHTFCRLCSRELWVQRGNCPLCNGFIVEILDIF